MVQRDTKGLGYALLQVTGVGAGGDRGSEQDLPFGVAPPVDVPFLLSLLGLSSFDLIRMDIEGSEMEVLSPHAKYVSSCVPHALLTPRMVWTQSCACCTTTACVPCSQKPIALVSQLTPGLFLPMNLCRGYPSLRSGSLVRNEPLWWASQAKMAIVSTHESLVAGSEQLVRAAFPLIHFSIDFGPACSIFRRREVFQVCTVLGLSGLNASFTCKLSHGELLILLNFQCRLCSCDFLLLGMQSNVTSRL